MQQPYYAPAVSIYAGFWRRFVAYFIDGVIVSIPLSIVGGVIGGIAGAAGSTSPGEPPSTAGVAALSGVLFFVYALAFVATWLYFALLESSSYQATVGKMAMGVVVTDLGGQRISFGRATGRFFGKIVSALICYIGFIIAGFTQRKQALHDMMAGTLVVRKGVMMQPAAAYAPPPPAYQAPPGSYPPPPPGNYPPPPPSQS